MLRVRTLLVAGSMTAATLLGACGSGDDDAATISSPGVSLREGDGRVSATDDESETTTTADASATDDDTPLDAERGEERTTDEPGQSIASKELNTTNSEGQQVRIRIDILSLERGAGEVVRMDLRMTNLDDEAEWRPLGDFAASQVADFTLSGTSLIDLANDLRYLVLIDSEGDCLCSDVGTVTLSPGDFADAQASFPAPPADVAEVDIQLGELGVMGPVRVSDR